MAALTWTSTSLVELSSASRACLVMRERDDLSVVEIAAYLRVSREQVRDWLFEARERLCAGMDSSARRYD